MDQANVQLHVNRGLARVAAVLGSGFLQYRPSSAFDPVLAGSSIGTLPCIFDYNPNLSLQTPTPPGHPFVHLIGDPGQVQANDYLVGPETYLVSRVEALRPAWCVLCNKILNILDTAQTTVAGTNTYGGVTSANNTLLARGWPMSVLAKTRGEQDVTKLPSDTRSAFYEVMMPVVPGLILGLGLCLQDNSGQLYDVMSWETTAYGCKLIVGMATT